MEITMSKTASIFLTHQSPSQTWQQDNPIQIVNDDIFIQVKADDVYQLRAIQKAARKIEQLGVGVAKLSGEHWCLASQWAFAQGFVCVGKLTNVEFTGSSDDVNYLNDKLAVMAWSKDLTNQTPAQLYPTKLAELVTSYLTSQAPAAITSKVIAGEELVKENWMGIYNVGKGSQHPPCLLEIDYNPTGDANAPVQACLVGKGITFDSGGYSIKPSAGMFDMKADMGGASVVAGSMALAIRQGLKQRVKLFLCCAENMVSRDAYKLGDIITYKNGVTAEIANTDAEGRVVLADGLMAASETGAPLIIDAATLTGAAVNATGGHYTALFGLDQGLIEEAKVVAQTVNDPVWQLPLEPWHQGECPSAFADTANSRTQKGGGAGGASNAAGFLSRFVGNQGKGWLHCDLAGAYHGNGNAMWAAGATGTGVAMITELLMKKLA